VVHFGKIGTAGLKQEKKHASSGAANVFFQKMKASKLKKGYAPGKGGGGAAAAMKATAAMKRAMRVARGVAAAASSARSSGTKRKAPAPMATAMRSGKKGARSVDARVPNAASMSVVEDYAVKLNQTHVNANNNKYYIIQVLEDGGSYYAWNRWGRVGDPGQNKLSKCGTVEAAVKQFKSKFRSKTGNDWDNRDSFKARSGKYIIVETEDGGAGEEAPMGKLTKAQIGKGQAVLEKLEGELKRAKRKAVLDELSDQFYSLIPHNFGWKKPPAINTDKMMQEQKELLKFYLRMGFDEVEDRKLSPISGVMDIPVPPSLDAAASAISPKSAIKESESRAADLVKKQAGRPTKKMGLPQYGAIMLYTGNAIYAQLNKALRDGNRGTVKKYMKYLRLFFDAMGSLPKQKRTLWRGVSVDLFDNAQYKVGNTVTWWGVSSTTSDQNVARSFASSCGKSTLMTVEAKSASDISALSFYSNEKESLLAPGTQLQVVSKKRTGSMAEIKLKEVGNSIK